MQKVKDKYKFDPLKCEGADQYSKIRKEGPFAIPNTGAQYHGHCLNGKRHGIGVAKQPDGEYYIGFWVEDRYHGEGQLILPNGEGYIGDWHQGLKHGTGTYYYENEIYITCNWKADQKHGIGKIFSPDYNAHFSIGFKNGKLHGNCTVFEENGYYSGMFVDGKRHGLGNYIYKDTGKDSPYPQDYTEDIMHGFNCLRYANGEEV